MHLTELEIAAFIDKKSNKKQREKVLEHLQICSRCYTEFIESYNIVNGDVRQDLLAVTSDHLKVAENLVRKTALKNKLNNRKRNSKIRKFSFAILVLSFIISTLVFKTKLNNTKVEYRSKVSTQQLTLYNPADLSVIDSQHLNFNWSSIRGTNYYIFKIYDTIGDIVFEKPVKSIYIKLTNKLNLARGKKYLWQVIALSNSGKKVGSQLYVFTFKK